MFDLDPLEILARLIVLFLGVPLHEWAHCYAATLLGDDTPYLQNRMTLNPFAHLDPIGSLLILTRGFGWGRAASVNPYRMSRAPNARVGYALTAAAGPFSNFIQALIWALPLRLGLVEFLPGTLAGNVLQFLDMVIWINITLIVFNLLPIPPLDGSRILAGIVQGSVATFIGSLEPIAPMVWVVVIFLLPALGLNLVSGWIKLLAFPLYRAIVPSWLWW